MVQPDEKVFRVMAAAIVLSVAVMRDGVRIHRYLRTQPRPSLGKVLLDFVRNNQNARLGSLLMVILVVAAFGALFTYIVAPDSIGWARVEVPYAVRWIAVACASAGALGEMWGLMYLGRQWSGILRIRKDHELIEQGPYAWVRHPMYSFGLPLMAGLGFMAANWFILTTGVAAIILAMLKRVPSEEAMLIEAFGDSYRRYVERTGRFFPRFG